MLGASSFSDLCGLASIACWLGAQFPQVIENFRRQSCEGLSLPFLANWLLGDVSNLVGCILTHQLPFQTWLATYFVSVDLMIVIQYAYYYHKPMPPLEARVYAPIRSASSPAFSRDRSASQYRTMTSVLVDVAAAEMMAAQQEKLPPINSHPDNNAQGGISWSTERYGARTASIGPSYRATTASIQPLSPIESSAAHERGRPVHRELETATQLHTEPIGTVSQRESRSSKKGTIVAFFGVFALLSFGFMSSGMGTLAGNKVTSVGSIPFTTNNNLHFSETTPAFLTIHTDSLSHTNQLEYLNSVTIPSTSEDSSVTSHPRSNRQILGRFFAWLCTLLYLTSRLPQIWKNYGRKSVEGLSMYLFVFAFLGNTFYVSSILSSPNLHQPPPASIKFLRESIPYLLGSAGTLLFDVTIVTQSFIYRPRLRRLGGHNNKFAGEEDGLLAGDALAAHRRILNQTANDPAAEPRGRTSRPRNTTP